MVAEHTFRKLHAPELMAEVAAGAAYSDGVKVTLSELPQEYKKRHNGAQKSKPANLFTQELTRTSAVVSILIAGLSHQCRILLVRHHFSSKTFEFGSHCS